MTNPILLAVAAVAFSLGCAGSSARTYDHIAPASGPRTLGTLFIVGGGPQPPALVESFVARAGGRGKARIVVVPMASASGPTSGEEKAKDLRTLGASAINVVLTREQANTDSAARLFADATGIWFGGGDQVRLNDIIRGTKVDSAIAARYRAGAVIGGTSAGAAVMSTPMITGDERRPGGARPPNDSGPQWMTIDRNDVVTVEGLGLVRDAIIDQHFLRRRRHNRLVSLVLEGPPHLGAGIEESTALLIHPDGHWSVEGASVVVIYDARSAITTPSSAATLGGVGLTMHVLPAGSTFDPRTGRATLSDASKTKK
jgi:cyanophycinase